MTHPEFLRLYQQILKPGGRVRLKTDSPVLHRFTRLVIELYGLKLWEDSTDVYADIAAGRLVDSPAQGVSEPAVSRLSEELSIKTHYERLDIAQSNRIHYLCFSLPVTPLPQIDSILHERCKQDESAAG